MESRAKRIGVSKSFVSFACIVTIIFLFDLFVFVFVFHPAVAFKYYLLSHERVALEKENEERVLDFLFQVCSFDFGITS